MTQQDMTPPGHPSLPSCPRISQNLKAKLVMILELMPPLSIYGALPTHWMRIQFGWGCSKRNLTSTATKWYIELPSTAFNRFWDLANAFLSHFQLPVQYDFGTDLLPSSRMSHSYFGSQPRVEKTEEPYQSHYSSRFLIRWFLKSLLPYISKDVSTSRVTNEE